MDYAYLLLAIVFGLASFFFARAKRRNPWLWFLLGLFFSFVPLVVLAVLPNGDLEDEVYRLKAIVRQFEEEKKRKGVPDIKIQKTKVDHG